MRRCFSRATSRSSATVKRSVSRTTASSRSRPDGCTSSRTTFPPRSRTGTRNGPGSYEWQRTGSPETVSTRPGGGARRSRRLGNHDQRAGQRVAGRPRSAAALERAAIHIARPLGLDPATTPVLDARLDDGSRVAICVPPASPSVAITVRRFGKRSFSAEQLVAQGALPVHIRDEAERVLHTRRTILVSGGTGSGKTTLLNALIKRVPSQVSAGSRISRTPSQDGNKMPNAPSS